MKKFLTIAAIIFVGLFLTACKPPTPHSIILFNKYPITKETFLNNSTEFDLDKRIYFVFMTEKPLNKNNEKIRIKIYKRDSKANDFVSKLVYCKDFRLMKNDIYYYTDYFVMNEKGTFCMMVYKMDRLDRPEAVADFKVK